MVGGPKTSGSRRTVPMFNFRGELIAHHRWQIEHNLDATGYVFVNQSGRALAPWTFNKRELDRIAQAAGTD